MAPRTRMTPEQVAADLERRGVTVDNSTPETRDERRKQRRLDERVVAALAAKVVTERLRRRSPFG